MPFFPVDRPVPDRLMHPSFVLRPLDVAAAELDYDAYTNSPDVIAVHSGGRWQVEGYTLADETRELAQHEQRHHDRQDFAFIILAPAQQVALGCVYLLPLLRYTNVPDDVRGRVSDASAIVTFWIRQSHQGTPLPHEVVAAVDTWLRNQWPFDWHVFRVNQHEHRSIEVLEQHGMTVAFKTTFSGPPHCYLFFAS